MEPVYPSLDPGESASRAQAAWKLVNNHEAVARFALRGAGTVGAKRFQVGTLSYAQYSM